MTTQSFDTHSKAEEVQLALLRRATVAQRLTVMRSLSRTTLQLSRRAIQRANPTYTQQELNLTFVAYHYGAELAARLERYLEQREHATI